MQKYTKKKLRDIKLAHYKEADDELSKNGPALIAGGNEPAYRRNFWKYHTRALENIIKDIAESEKKALSRMTAFPMTQYFSTLKKETLDIIKQEVSMLNKKFGDHLPPNIEGHKHTSPNQSPQTEKLSDSLHDLISRTVDRLEIELKWQLLKKVRFWLVLLAILPLLALKSYLISLVKYFIR